MIPLPESSFDPEGGDSDRKINIEDNQNEEKDDGDLIDHDEL